LGEGALASASAALRAARDGFERRAGSHPDRKARLGGGESE
jgi:hypothetical protein